MSHGRDGLDNLPHDTRRVRGGVHPDLPNQSWIERRIWSNCMFFLFMNIFNLLVINRTDGVIFLSSIWTKAISLSVPSWRDTLTEGFHPLRSSWLRSWMTSDSIWEAPTRVSKSNLSYSVPYSGLTVSPGGCRRVYQSVGGRSRGPRRWGWVGWDRSTICSFSLCVLHRSLPGSYFRLRRDIWSSYR